MVPLPPDEYDEMTPKQLEALRLIEGLQKARECIDNMLKGYIDDLKGSSLGTLMDELREQEEQEENTPAKRHTMTEEGKAAVAKAQKKRWESYRKQRNRDHVSKSSPGAKDGVE